MDKPLGISDVTNYLQGILKSFHSLLLILILVLFLFDSCLFYYVY